MAPHGSGQYFVHGSDELWKVEPHRGISRGSPGQSSTERKQEEPAKNKKKTQLILLLKHIRAPAFIDDIANIHLCQPSGLTHQVAYVEFNCVYSPATKQAKQNEHLKENLLYNTGSQDI